MKRTLIILAAVACFLILKNYLSSYSPPISQTHSKSFPSSSTAPIVPNVQLPPQEKEYLQKAYGLLINNGEADEQMLAYMQRANDQTATVDQIRRVIELSRNLHEEMFAHYQT